MNARIQGVIHSVKVGWEIDSSVDKAPIVVVLPTTCTTWLSTKTLTGFPTGERTPRSVDCMACLASESPCAPAE